MKPALGGRRRLSARLPARRSIMSLASVCLQDTRAIPPARCFAMSVHAVTSRSSLGSCARSFSTMLSVACAASSAARGTSPLQTVSTTRATAATVSRISAAFVTPAMAGTAALVTPAFFAARALSPSIAHPTRTQPCNRAWMELSVASLMLSPLLPLLSLSG